MWRTRNAVRHLASLIIVLALAAPFGGAGALSLGADARWGAAATTDARDLLGAPDAGGHGVIPTSPRMASSGEGTGSGPSSRTPSTLPPSRVRPWPEPLLRPSVTSPHGVMDGVPSGYLAGFHGHPTTAPPHKV